MSDQSQGEPEATDGQKASILSISRRTVMRIKQRFVQGSLEVALTGSFPRERPERRCLDGKGEAQLIHLACSQAAFRAATLDTGSVSRQDGAPGLCGAHQSRDSENHAQKNELKPWLKISWCFLKARQTESLSTTWRMCWMSIASPMTQPFPGSVGMRWGRIWPKTSIPPNEASPGQVAREDYSYEKEGRANLFIAYEPKAGQTHP